MAADRSTEFQTHLPVNAFVRLSDVPVLLTWTVMQGIEEK